MRLAVKNSSSKFCVPFPPIITKKCGMLLLLLAAILITMAYHFPTLTLSLPPKMQSEVKSNMLPELDRRPKTRLIFNNKDLCTSNLFAAESKQRTVVIVVLSARYHFAKRNLIRQTYGSRRFVNNIHILAVVFMLGSSDESGRDEVSSKLDAERLQHNDLIMGDFVDSYRNLTRKSIMAYEWLTSFCKEAQFVVKTDDDVVLNIFKLSEELGTWSPTELQTSNIWCAVHYKETVITDVRNIFHVAPNEFPNATFPDHCAGLGYVTTIDVIRRIINEISSSFLKRVCTHEDVFMTAIVPNKINSNLKESNQNEPIQLVDRYWDWVSFDLQTMKSNNAQFLLKLFREPYHNVSEYEFRRRFDTKIFYLLAHNTEFAERYHKLWQIIEKIFHNKKDDDNND